MIRKNKKEKINILKDKIKLSLPQFGDISLVTISALKIKVYKLKKQSFQQRKIETKINTAKLNNWLSIKTAQHPPPMFKGKRLKLRYITQIKSHCLIF